jgi:hypothetical protein
MIRHLLVISWLGLMSIACSPGRHFSGDGEFVAVGRWPFTNYEVHFETLAATTPGVYSWRFEGLPRMPAAVQIAIDTRRSDSCETLEESSALRHAEVSLELHHSGERVAHTAGRLEDWVWTYALGGPWGTDWSTNDCAVYADTLFFSGERSGAYELTLEVRVAADEAPPVRAVVASFAVYTP